MRDSLGRHDLEKAAGTSVDHLRNIIIRLYLELGPLGVVALGVLGFVAFANARAVLGEEPMEKPQRIGQLYGYTVCLVSVVTFLTSANSLIHSAFTLADPIASEPDPFRMGWEPSVSSFEAFQATYMFGTGGAMVTSRGGRGASADTSGRVDTLTTAELQRRYQALRTERVTTIRYGATRQATTSLILILLSAALFALHWRWLRTRERVATPGSAPA